MSAKQAVRGLLGVRRPPVGSSFRRQFASTPRRCAAGRGAGPATPAADAPAADAPAAAAWSGRGVVAIAAAAGVLGWAVASTLTGRNDQQGRRISFDSDPNPRYASMFEMERVGLPPWMAHRQRGYNM